MNKAIMAFVAAALVAAGALAQKQGKPWVEWSRKDAEKILADSPWSQTQTETDTSEMFYTPTTMGDTHARESQGATNQATSVRFHIRFFTARPVRQAYVRLLELNQSQPDDGGAEKRHAWANLAAGDSVIITVACDSNDKRYLGRAMQAFSSAVTSVLKNSAYLERSDGKRVFLGDYVAPTGKDVFGARFVFPRTVDGQPFITPDSGSIRFHAEYESKTGLDGANPAGQASRRGSGSSASGQAPSPFKFKLDMKFKVAELMYDGELEY